MQTNLAKQIKELRNKHGLSQELLAEKTNLSLRTIQRVENAETEPRGNTLLRLAEAFEVTPDELLEWNQTEDISTLLVLNLSALSFLIFPILGVLIPLIIWITKKDTVKNASSVGKELLNFQLSFCGFVYLLEGFFYIAPFLELPFLENLNNIEIIEPYLIPMIVWGIIYGYNLFLVIINSFKIRADHSVSYRPKIRFIR